MSREFGNLYNGGYFHDEIRHAAEDCATGRDQLTKLWGEFLEEFYNIAYQISNSEASDSGPYAPIIESINRMESLKAALDKINEYLDPFRDVMAEAVRNENEKKGGKK